VLPEVMPQTEPELRQTVGHGRKAGEVLVQG